MAKSMSVRDGRIEPCPDGDDDGLTSFAVLGDVLVVREATPHRLRIYRRVGGSWTLDGLITPPTSHGFGTVALGGNRLFVNLAGPDEPEGAVLVYRHNPNLADPPPTDPCGTPGPGKWRQKGLFTLEPGHRVSGVVASRAGTRLLVSDAYVEDVHVIEQEGTDWVDVARLTRSPFDPSFGAFPHFGGPGGDSFAVIGGSATWVFARTDDGWTQVSYSNYPSRLVDATEDTVFSVDYVADDIKVHGIDPLCAAE
jgi:hypothetical protein